MPGTVEDRILALQRSKRRLADAALGGGEGEGEGGGEGGGGGGGGGLGGARLTAEDLRFLFTGERR